MTIIETIAKYKLYLDEANRLRCSAKISDATAKTISKDKELIIAELVAQKKAIEDADNQEIEDIKSGKVNVRITYRDSLGHYAINNARIGEMLCKANVADKYNTACYLMKNDVIRKIGTDFTFEQAIASVEVKDTKVEDKEEIAREEAKRTNTTQKISSFTEAVTDESKDYDSITHTQYITPAGIKYWEVVENF